MEKTAVNWVTDHGPGNQITTESSNHGAAARYQLEEQDYYSDDQQQMDETATNSTDQPQ